MKNILIGLTFIPSVILVSCDEQRNPVIISKTQLQGTWQLDRLTQIQSTRKLNNEGDVSRTLEFKIDGTGCATNIRVEDLCGAIDSFWYKGENRARRVEKPEYMGCNLPRDFVWTYRIGKYEGAPAVYVQLIFDLGEKDENYARLVFRQQGSFYEANNRIEFRFYDAALEADIYFPMYATYCKL